MGTTSVAGTPGTAANPITNQLAAFGVFSVAMLGLGAFPKTHSAAMWIMGIVALVILIKWANGGFTASSTGS